MPKHKVEEISLEERAPSLETVFSKMAVSMFNIVINSEDVDLAVTKTIIIRSRDLKNLLYQFLKRLFDLANNELFLLSTVKQITIEQVSHEYLLNAVIIGDKMNDKYEVKDIVKQVTERNIIVKESIDGASAQINLVVERRNVKDNEV